MLVRTRYPVGERDREAGGVRVLDEALEGYADFPPHQALALLLAPREVAQGEALLRGRGPLRGSPAGVEERDVLVVGLVEVVREGGAKLLPQRLHRRGVEEHTPVARQRARAPRHARPRAPVEWRLRRGCTDSGCRARCSGSRGAGGRRGTGPHEFLEPARPGQGVLHAAPAARGEPAPRPELPEHEAERDRRRGRHVNV
mmetsp:Transcript_59438/g.167440  ORF Transcript_59438/g.167440 Transcript_59438/m.167440 type:complete len:200 (-) Transcript_59438:109-708(-)